MTTYYVGSGGNNGNAGTSWGARKLTLNGAEDIPVAAGDTVYVAPGVYRESLTVDVSGSGGSPITYIADVTGENTDGVGGVVRITGSDNDTTATRASCITASAKTYRTFRGFTLDTTSGDLIGCTSGCTNWIVEDCHLTITGSGEALEFSGAGQSALTVRRCMFVFGNSRYGVYLTHSSTVDNCAHVVENCVFVGNGRGVQDDRIGGVTVRNCLFVGGSNGVRCSVAPSVGQTITVNNCVLFGTTVALQATATTDITENYNALFGNGTDRTNVTAGANSNAYPPLLNPLQLLSGFNLPQFAPWSLSEWSQVRAITGTGTATLDLYGLTRPATAGKISWGPVQWVDATRDTGTVQAGSASLKIADAGLVRVRRVPTTNVSTTISLYVRWEADYAGTKPRMVIKQPGQSDRTTTATGSSGAWEQLTDTFTPAALPPYVDVFVESSNTATSGSYGAYVDTMAVS